MNSPRLANRLTKPNLSSRLNSLPLFRVATRLATVSGLLVLAACVSTQTLEAGESLVTATLIGQEREAVMSQTGDLEAAEARCETVKTGVGVNRRAYFLETCTWQQPSGYRMCGRQPETVEYAFLEGRLVAAMFGFTDEKESELQACIKDQALAGGYNVESGELLAGQASRLSNAETKTAITMTDAAVVHLFDSELAPKVHLLRDKL